MARPAEHKTHRFSIRLSQADIALIEHAAGLLGQSRTEFIRDAAVREAEEELTGNRLIQLSPEDSEALVAVLADPGVPVPELVELFRRPAPWE
jgi:uncharacterized protein (DUF1778 family)